MSDSSKNSIASLVAVGAISLASAVVSNRLVESYAKQQIIECAA